MEKLFFANKILLIQDFIKYAEYKTERLGCEVNNYFYLDNRIFAFNYQDGKFVDLNGNKYQIFNKKEIKNKDIISCNHCKYNDKNTYSHICQERPLTITSCIGITNIDVLTDFLTHYDTDKALKIIDIFNNDIGAYYTYIDNVVYDENIEKINNKVKRYLKK